MKDTQVVREHVRELVLVLEQEQNKNKKNRWILRTRTEQNRKIQKNFQFKIFKRYFLSLFLVFHSRSSSRQ